MVVVLIVLAVVGLLLRSELQRSRTDARAQLSSEVDALRSGLEQAVRERTVLADALAAFVQTHPDFTDTDFDRFADELIELQPDVRALQLAPGGVIRHVYPLAGNEQAVGLDLLAYVPQLDVVARTIDAPRFVVGGPLELVQGGQGIIGRLSIRGDGDGAVPDGEWWGLAQVVIDLDVVLEQAGFDDPALTGRYELRGVDGLGAEGARFAGVDLAGREPVRTTVRLPGGSWELAAIPEGGWSPWSATATFHLVGGTLLALTLGLLTFQLASEPARLRRRVDEATREAAQTAGHLRSVMNAAHDAILAVDPAGVIVGCNPAAEALLGYGVDGIRGRHVTDVVPHGLDDLLTSGSGGEDRRTALRATGMPFPADVSAAASADGEIVTVVLRDVTDQVASNHALQTYAAELQTYAAELERLNGELTRVDELKRDFVAMASHEMRTPITAVQGFALTLTRHWDRLSDEERLRCISAVQRQTQRLWSVVTDLLVAADIEAGTMHAVVVPTELGALLARVRDNLGVDAAQVRITVPDGLTVDLPRNHVERVVEALLSNATKYGAVPYELTAALRADDVVIEVRDHGEGVPEDFREHLFDRFTQASQGSRRTARGTGLGLAIARGLARAHGGDVEHVCLGAGAGACFVARFPVDGPAAPERPELVEVDVSR